MARKAKERREENARKTERFLPGRRRRRRSETVWSGRKSAHVDLNVEEEEEEEEDNNKGEEIEQPLLVLPRHSEPNVLYAKEEGEETETKKTTVSSKSISWWCSFTMPEDTEKEKRVKAIEKLRERRRGMSSSSKAEKKETKKESSFVQKEEEMMEEEDEDEEEEEEEKPIVSISSPRQNLKSKRFRMKQEVSESKDFAGQEAKLLASIARLDEVVKRNDINSMFAKEIEKREEETKTVTPKQENALKPSAARLNLELGLTNETIQIHDEKFFRELLQISRKCTQKSI